MSMSTRLVPYNDEEIALTGVLAWDDATSARRPGILLVHGGAGLDDHARDQARRYASLGYAVFAADMFGEGVAGNRERVIATLTPLRDNPGLLARRCEAGLAALAACPEAGSCIAAIGFCFGGLAALTLARSGAEIPRVVSVHGTLKSTQPYEPGSINAKVLACHGALDPHVPMADVLAFVEEMDRSRADWQLIVYGGAMHGFTHDRAVPGATPGVAYDALADNRSFAAIGSFLAELLPANPASALPL